MSFYHYFFYYASPRDWLTNIFDQGEHALCLYSIAIFFCSLSFIFAFYRKSCISRRKKGAYGIVYRSLSSSRNSEEGGDEGKGKSAFLLGFSACVALYQYPQIASERSLSVRFLFFFSTISSLFCFVRFLARVYAPYMAIFEQQKRGGGCRSQAKFHNDRRSQGTRCPVSFVPTRFRSANNKRITYKKKTFPSLFSQTMGSNIP